MAIVTGTNSSSPNTIKWATAGSDPYERATQLAGVAENFDLHDHSENKNLGIKRVQTSAAPTAAGHVRVNADTWQWWAASAAAVRTAVDVEGAQTVSGAKTFSAVTTFSNRTVWGTNATGVAGSVYKDTGGGLVAWGVTGGTAEFTVLNNAGAGVLTVPTGTQNVSLAGDFIMTGSPARIDTLSGAFMGLRLGSSSDVTTSNYNLASDTNGQLLVNALTGQTVNIRVANADALVVAAGGLAFLNDTSNASMTAGLTINQGAADNEILTLKSSDVAHGVTSVTETDSYGVAAKVNLAVGGLQWAGYSEATTGLELVGVHTTDDTARSTGAVGAAQITGYLKSGTGITTLGANANILVVRDSTNARFLVDKEGDIHMDATSNINAWDDHDDAALLEAYRVKTADPPNYRRLFATDVEAHARVLAETGVVTWNPDGHHFVSVKGLFGLVIDAVRQATQEARTARAEVAALRSHPALAGA